LRQSCDFSIGRYCDGFSDAMRDLDLREIFVVLIDLKTIGRTDVVVFTGVDEKGEPYCKLSTVIE
jgi:hypothetical protein